MKNKQFLIGLGLILLIIIIALYAQNKKKEAKKSAITGITPGSGTGVVKTFPLKVGSFGEEVRVFQTYLRSLDPKSLPQFGIDGQFGPETQAESQRLIGKTQVDQSYYEKVVKPAYSVVASLVNSIGLTLPAFRTAS